MKLVVYTDGASRGNPGHASFGFTISEKSGKLLFEKGEYIGIATNNVAEYKGVLEALKAIQNKFVDKEIESIEFFADSKLAVEQLSGRFKVKSMHLLPLIQEIKVLALNLGGATFTHIPRAQNSKADKLANIALDSR